MKWIGVGTVDNYLPLAEQIIILFDSVRHPEGRPFTLQEVSDATGVSLGTIAQMRSGKINNPQLNTLRTLAQFFRVPLRYFETGTREECYALLADPTVSEKPALSEIAFRASGLSEQAQQDILSLIKVFQEEENQRREKSASASESDDEQDEETPGDGS
jgi:transcriptional regulator with XRE-family HTH domain